jgi:hypothetical protein
MIYKERLSLLICTVLLTGCEPLLDCLLSRVINRFVISERGCHTFDCEVWMVVGEHSQPIRLCSKHVCHTASTCHFHPLIVCTSGSIFSSVIFAEGAVGLLPDMQTRSPVL